MLRRRQRPPPVRPRGRTQMPAAASAPSLRRRLRKHEAARTHEVRGGGLILMCGWMHTRAGGRLDPHVWMDAHTRTGKGPDAWLAA
eukprot:358855-Chlamydomonas_euryale.AAC.1